MPASAALPQIKSTAAPPVNPTSNESHSRPDTANSVAHIAPSILLIHAQFPFRSSSARFNILTLQPFTSPSPSSKVPPSRKPDSAATPQATAACTLRSRTSGTTVAKNNKAGRSQCCSPHRQRHFGALLPRKMESQSTPQPDRSMAPPDAHTILYKAPSHAAAADVNSGNSGFLESTIPAASSSALSA